MQQPHTVPGFDPAPDRRSALQWARAIRAGECSCVQAAEASLSRIAACDDGLGAFVDVWPERALARARALDRGLREGPPPGALFGVPVGVKDLDPTRGGFSRMGSRAYRYLWAPADGPVSKRLRGAGCNLVGKTATSEFGILPITETALHPPCRNAHDPRYTSGGSSGGSATAVASGMVPIAHGSDGAGSIRIPASLAGLFGFKPSRGLLPAFYGKMDRIGLAVVGALAWDVADSAVFLDLLRGVHYAPDAAPDASLLQQAGRDPGRLRIRFSLESPEAEVRPEVARAVAAVAQRLSRLGHDVEQAPMLDARLPEFQPLWERMAANVPLLSESLAEPTTRYLRERGRRHAPAAIAATAAGLTDKVLRWFGDADAWLTPTIGPAPPRVGQYAGLDGEQRFAAVAPLGAFTAAFNVSGQPAASVPVGRCALGLPFGAQLVGRSGEDGRLLALCAQLSASLSSAPVDA